jgi:hypothetical protein
MCVRVQKIKHKIKKASVLIVYLATGILATYIQHT